MKAEWLLVVLAIVVTGWLSLKERPPAHYPDDAWVPVSLEAGTE